MVVEDDTVIARGLAQAFDLEGYKVLLATDGDSAVYMSRTEDVDLVVLDVMMPGLNGFEVTTELRRSGDSVPILILSARTETRDKVRGLDLGADDYLEKPFDLDELLARVRRLLTRTEGKAQTLGDCIYDWKLRMLTSSKTGEAIALTPKERRLLEFFLKRSGQIVSREKVLDGVWGADYDGTDRTVDNVIMSLRKKIGGECLLTERGFGYRFVTKA